MLITHFRYHHHLILLSENIRNDKHGLRRILSTIVAPALNNHSEKIGLTTIFKRGKTSIEDYCGRVIGYFEKQQFSPGYNEVLL